MTKSTTSLSPTEQSIHSFNVFNNMSNYAVPSIPFLAFSPFHPNTISGKIVESSNGSRDNSSTVHVLCVGRWWFVFQMALRIFHSLDMNNTSSGARMNAKSGYLWSCVNHKECGMENDNQIVKISLRSFEELRCLVVSGRGSIYFLWLWQYYHA